MADSSRENRNNMSNKSYTESEGYGRFKRFGKDHFPFFNKAHIGRQRVETCSTFKD